MSFYLLEFIVENLIDLAAKDTFSRLDADLVAFVDNPGPGQCSDLLAVDDHADGFGLAINRYDNCTQTND